MHVPIWLCDCRVLLTLTLYECSLCLALPQEVLVGGGWHSGRGFFPPLCPPLYVLHHCCHCGWLRGCCHSLMTQPLGPLLVTEEIKRCHTAAEGENTPLITLNWWIASRCFGGVEVTSLVYSLLLILGCSRWLFSVTEWKSQVLLFINTGASQWLQPCPLLKTCLKVCLVGAISYTVVWVCIIRKKLVCLHFIRWISNWLFVEYWCKKVNVL